MLHVQIAIEPLKTLLNLAVILHSHQLACLSNIYPFLHTFILLTESSADSKIRFKGIINS